MLFTTTDALLKKLDKFLYSSSDVFVTAAEYAIPEFSEIFAQKIYPIRHRFSRKPLRNTMYKLRLLSNLKYIEWKTHVDNHSKSLLREAIMITPSGYERIQNVEDMLIKNAQKIIWGICGALGGAGLTVLIQFLASLLVL